MTDEQYIAAVDFFMWLTKEARLLSNPQADLTNSTKDMQRKMSTSPVKPVRTYTPAAYVKPPKIEQPLEPKLQTPSISL